MKRGTLIAAALAALAAPSWGQTPTLEPIPNAFRDLERSEASVLLPLSGDDEGLQIEVGFDFPFYGQTRSIVTVTTNGYLTFGNSVAPLNDPIPDPFVPNAVLAPFWDDLDTRPSPDAAILIERFGFDIGKRSLIVQWTQLAHKDDPGARLTFQVVLFETGEFQFRYGPMLNGAGEAFAGLASGSSASIGIEDFAGTRGLRVAFNREGAVTPATAYAFLPSGVGLPEGQLLADLDNDGRVTVLDQALLTELGYPLRLFPATARELIASDVHPASTAGGFGGDGLLNALDRDLLSRVIVEREDLGPYLSELLPASPGLGDTLTLTGSGFDTSSAAANVVVLPAAGGGTIQVPAQTVNATGSRLTLTVPPTARRGVVYVLARGRRTNLRALGVSGVPAILGVTPNPAVIGETVEVRGVEFPTALADTTVTIGTLSATVVSNVAGAEAGERVLSVEVPLALSAGVHDVVVSSPTATGEPWSQPFGDLPVVEIQSPSDGTALRDLTSIVGSVVDTDLERYEIAVAPLGEGDFAPIHSGTSTVESDELGTLDPTMLINGFYRVRLTAVDQLGLTASTEVSVSIQGPLKLGHYTISFTDLELPVAGIAIRVVREYDSRDLVSRDFGYGWRLRLVTLKLDEDDFHNVIVQNPASNRIEYAFTPEQQSPLDPRFFTAKFTNSDPTERSRLDFEAPVGVSPGNTDLARDSVGNFLFFPEGIPFDPTTYRITQVDGTVLRVADESVFSPQKGLLQVLTPAGPTLTVTPEGLFHSSGRSVTFERDALGRITQIVDPRNSGQTYEYDDRGDLVTHTNADGDDSSYVYLDNHYLLEHYDARGVRAVRNEYDDSGRLAATIDPFGQRIEFEHDLDGKREIVRDQLGRPTITEYDARGRAVKLIDPDGLFTELTYNPLDQLTQRIDRAGKVWTYTYDAAGNQDSQTDPEGNTISYTYDARGNILTITDADDGVTTYTYNAQNRMLTSEDPAGGTTERTYDAQGNVLSERNEAGETTAYGYNDQGDLTRREDTKGHVILFSYDANGNVVSETSIVPQQGAPAVRATKTFGYDASNRRVLVVRPDGTSETRQYGAGGYLARQSDSAGRSQTFTHDELGRLTRRVAVDGTAEVREYDATGVLVALEDASGRQAHEINGRGQPTKITYPDGSTLELEYDALGRLEARTDARSNRWEFVYDDAGRLLTETAPDLSVTTYTYDGKGNVRTRTDADMNVTTYTYDAMGRLLTTEFPNGLVETVERDLAGRVTQRTDIYGRVTEFTYDAYADKEQATLPQGFTRFTRDQEGRLLTLTDLNTHVTSFRYDPLTGHRTAVVLPLGQEANFTWENGFLASETDFNGQTTQLEHNAQGNLVFRQFPDGTGERIGYDARGERVVSVEDVSGLTRLVRDPAGRLLERIDSDGVRLTYSYDPNGNVNTVVSPIGTTTYTWDAFDRLASVTDIHSQTTSYTYKATGVLHTISRPNGVTTEFTADELGTIERVEHRGAGGAVLAGYTYAYNTHGQRSSVTEDSGRVVSYEYDSMLRLTGERIQDVAGVTSTAYTYDAWGNRQQQVRERPDGSVLTVVYTHDDNDRLTREDVTDSQGAGSSYAITYTYDDNGSVLSRAAPDEVVVFTYDALRRMTGAVVTRGAEVDTYTYRYDYFGNRVETILNGVSTRHVVDANRPFAHVIADLDADGNTVASYSQGLQTVSVTDESGQTHYLLPDGLFSTRYVSDSTGQLQGGYDYDAYGVLLQDTTTSFNPYRYTGERFESGTGLYHLRSRDLDPRTGRFQTRDAFEGFAYDPPTLHVYSYALQNPVNRVDPAGTFSISLPFLISYALPMALSQLDQAADHARLGQARRITDMLGALNLFLPKTLDIMGSDQDLILAQRLISRALTPEGADRVHNSNTWLPRRVATNPSFLFGAKVQGAMGSDLRPSLYQQPSGDRSEPSIEQRLALDLATFGPPAGDDTWSTVTRLRSVPLVKEIEEWLTTQSGTGEITRVRLGAYQIDWEGQIVGYGRVDISFTVPATRVRWNFMINLGAGREGAASISRILANDSRAIACELAEGATLEDFLEAIRWNCNTGPAVPFVLSLKQDGPIPEIVKDALPVQNKRQPLPQNQTHVGMGVIASNGEFVLTRDDMQVPGRGLSWQFSRVYRSGVSYPNEPGVTGLRMPFHLGHNWTTNYDYRLGDTGSGNLTEFGWLGRTQEIYKQRLADLGLPEPVYERPAGVFATVMKKAVRFKRILAGATEATEVLEIGYVRRRPDGMLETFNAAGWVVAQADRFGNTIELHRDVDQILRLAIDPVGRRYRYEYATFGGDDQGEQQLLVRVVDETGGRTLAFEYDSTTLDLVASVSPEGRREEYTYSTGRDHPALNHNLLTITAPNQASAVGQNNVPVVQNTYFESDSLDYAFDSVISQRYGGTLALESITGETTSVSAGSDLGLAIQLVFEELSPLASTLEPDRVATRTVVTDRRGFGQAYEFNRGGNALRHVDRAGEVTTSEFDRDGLLIRTVRPSGVRTIYGYDTRNPVRTQAGNLLIHMTLPALGDGSPALVTEYDYEPFFGQRIRTTDAPGFLPVFTEPDLSTDPRTWLEPSLRYEEHTDRTIFDYQEAAAPLVPGFLQFNLGFDLADIQAKRLAAAPRWVLPLGEGDLNGDGTVGPDRAYDFSGIGFRGLVVEKRRREVLLLGATPQVTRETFQFNEFGQPTRQVDGEGNHTTFHYYPVGVAYDPATGAHPGYMRELIRDDLPVPGVGVARTTSASPVRASIVTTYDRYGNARDVTDAIGTTTSYVRDADNLVREIRRASNVAELNYLIRRTYDLNGNLILEEVEDKGGEGVVPGRFFARRALYDICNNVVETADRLDTPSGERWLRTQHRYDAGDLRVETILPEENRVTWTHDTRRLKTSETRGAGTPDAATTEWEYNAFRQVKVTRLPDEVEIEHFYDGFERAEATRRPDATIETRTYDLVGNINSIRVQGLDGGGAGASFGLLAETRYVRDSAHRLLAEERVLITGPTGPYPVVVTSQDHDRLDRIVTREEPDRERTTHVFDGLSREVATIDAAGNRIEREFDANDNLLIQRQIETSIALPGLPAETFTSTTRYDALNRPVEVVDNVGQTTRMEFDSRDNVVLRSDPEGIVTPSGNDQGNVIRMRFDSVNRRVALVTELRVGGVGGGALDTANLANPDGLITQTWEYDDNSRLVGYRDDEGNLTRSEYDDLDRKTAQVNADETRYTISYNLDSTVRETVDPNGTTTLRSYDSVDRLIRIEVSPVTSQVVGTTLVTQEYDGLDRPTRGVDNNGHEDSALHRVVEQEWDSLSRLVAETQNGRRVASTWSDDDRRLTCEYAGGRLISYDHDVIDRVTAIREGGTAICEAGYMGPGSRELFRRHQNGTVLSFVDDLAAPTQTVGYDGVQRVTRAVWTNAGGTTVLDREYGYNRASYVTSERRHDDGGLTDGYEYDSAYRIISTRLDQGTGGVKRDVAQLDYVLDGVGNRREVLQTATIGTVTSSAYVVNDVNEYTSVAGELRLHDDNGNLIDDGVSLYRYDYKNRLVEIADKTSGELIARYTYDSLDRRVRREVTSAAPVAAETLEYVYDGVQVIEERSATGQVLISYVYSPNSVDMPIQATRTAAHALGSGTIYYHQNLRRDVAAITDSTGLVVETIRYDDFGQAEIRDGSGNLLTASAVGNPYLFQGRRFDAESGLYYLRDRYYDASTGRFLQRDSVFDPASLGNQYTFAGNSPASMADPTGRYAESAWDLFSLSVGVVSLGANLAQGNFRDAAIDLVGVVADLVALALPVPGGAGAAIKLWRGGKAFKVGCKARRVIVGIQSTDHALTAYQAGKGAYESYQEGDTFMAAFQGAMAGMAGVSALAKGLRVAKGFCFLPGTLVETEDGKVAIENVRVGQQVWSRDPLSGEWGFKRVVRLYRGQTDRVLYLRVAKARAGQRGRGQRHRVGLESGGSSEEGGEPPLAEVAYQTIRSTVGHPYQRPDGSSVAAIDLQVGDELVAANGEPLVVVGKEVRDEESQHYNLEVEDWHTYFVAGSDGEPAVWVHNTCASGIDQATYRGLRRKFRLRRLADNPAWSRLWGRAVSELGDNARSLVSRQRRGQKVDPERLFNSVRDKFVELAKESGVRLPRSGGKVMPIHHWNWNKEDFASIVIDPRQLFFAQPRFHNATDTGIHQFLQTPGRHPTVDPIPDRWRLNVNRSFLNR